MTRRDLVQFYYEMELYVNRKVTLAQARKIGEKKADERLAGKERLTY